VSGRTYTGMSRMAPANDIARQLVADGVPDAPMQVYTEGLKGCLVWRSFYSAAGYTFEENDRAPVKRRRPRPSQNEQGVPTGPKQGVNAPAGTPAAREPSRAPADEFEGACHYVSHVFGHASLGLNYDAFNCRGLSVKRVNLNGRLPNFPLSK
jgi:hypothetical protein